MKTVHLLACSIAFASMLGAQTGGLASVEGQVVSTAAGAPVRRATVSLMRTTGRMIVPGEPPQGPMSPLTAETDEQGRFAFHGLEAGGYRVTVQRQGFVMQNGMAGVQQTELWLGEGQQLTGYVVRATPQSVIAGTVVDDYGDPVMGAQVSVQRNGSENGGRGMTVGSAQTNDLGEYRIANLGAGDYIVAASYANRNAGMVASANQQGAAAKPQLVYATTYHPGTAVASEAAAVRVTDGAVTSAVDIKLAKIEAYSVHVTVSDPDAPATNGGAYPNLRPREPGVGFAGYFGPVRQQDGTFLFNGVPPGSYVLSAQRSGGVGAPGATASASMPIEVRDRNLEDIVLQVKPNADLQGAVRFEQVGECDAANMSVSLRQPGPPGGPIYGPMPQPAQVGADLRFTLKSVPPGVYAVNLYGNLGRCYVKSMFYGGQAVPDETLTVGSSGALDLVLVPYSAQLRVTVVDAGGNPVARARIEAVPKDGGGYTMGNTYGSTGPSGQVILASIRPGTYEVYAFETPGQTAPFFPQNGDALKPFAGRSKTVTVPQTGQSAVEVTAIPASETGAGAPPPAPPAGAKGSLAGKVVNAVSGAAMPGVVVTLRGQFSPVGPQGTPAATDDQGRFSFPGLTPGQYILTAAEQRFVAGAASPTGVMANQVIVGEGQQITAYVLKLAPAGVIAGTVKDESGQPVLGAQIQLFRYRNQMGERRLMAAGGAYTNDLGEYRSVNLAPGDYYVALARVVERPAPRNPQTPDSITGPLPSGPETDFVPMWYPNAAQQSGATAVKVAVGATAGNIDMTWRRSPVTRIRGKAVDAAGNAVGTPTVRLIRKGALAASPPIGSQTVARDGSFEISGVPPGSYTLIARPGPAGGGRGMQVGVMVVGGSAQSNRMAVQAIDVKDAPIDGITLELSSGRTIRGTIKMDGGGQIPRPGFLSLRSDEGSGGAINIAGDGTFTVSNIYPLVYTVNTQNLPANCYIESIRYGGKDVPPAGLEFTGDGQLEVVLSNTAAVLEGSVAGADSKPASLAAVVVAPVTGPAPARTGNADSNGNFYFANLPPGEYRVAAWDASTPEASDPPESLAALARYAKTVTLGASAHEKVQVTVVPAGR